MLVKTVSTLFSTSVQVEFWPYEQEAKEPTLMRMRTTMMRPNQALSTSLKHAACK